jgi:hypothetical protein
MYFGGSKPMMPLLLYDARLVMKFDRLETAGADEKLCESRVQPHMEQRLNRAKRQESSGSMS